MDTLSMIEARRFTGMNKPRLLKMARNGELPGAYRDEGRTGHWHIPKEALEHLRAQHKGRLTMDNTIEQRTEAIADELFGPLAEPEKLLTIREVARLVGRNQSLILRHAHSGDIKSVKRANPTGKGFKFLIPESELEHFDKVQRRPPNLNAGRKPGGTNAKPHPPSEMVRAVEIANELGVHVSTLYDWIRSGKVYGEQVQVGPRRSFWFVDGAEAREYGQFRRQVGVNGSGRHIGTKDTKPRVPWTPKPVAPELPTTDGLLTQKLLDLAELVRNNPMLTVESCEVIIKLKG